MEAMNFILRFAILTLLLTFLDYGKCHPDNNTENLTRRQDEVIQNYYRIGSLYYGEKCDPSLESEGIELIQVNARFQRQVLTSARQRMVDVMVGPIILTPSEKYVLDLIVHRMEKFTKRVNESKVGLHGICNPFEILHCDPKIGECVRGKSEDVRGSSLLHEDGICKYDFGSGCIQYEISRCDNNNCVCRKGSTCVTGIENLECTWENTIREREKNTDEILRMEIFLGHVCYCERVGNIKNVPGNNSAPQVNCLILEVSLYIMVVLEFLSCLRL